MKPRLLACLVVVLTTLVLALFLPRNFFLAPTIHLALLLTAIVLAVPLLLGLRRWLSPPVPAGRLKPGRREPLQVARGQIPSLFLLAALQVYLTGFVLASGLALARAPAPAVYALEVAELRSCERRCSGCPYNLHVQGLGFEPLTSICVADQALAALQSGERILLRGWQSGWALQVLSINGQAPL